MEVRYPAIFQALAAFMNDTTVGAWGAYLAARAHDRSS
jgi:hypothetical protein